MIVKTENSTYRLDVESQTVTRLSNDDHRTMRKDDVPLSYEWYDEPIVGKRWIMTLNLRDDGVTTIRSTSPVTSIEPDSGE